MLMKILCPRTAVAITALSIHASLSGDALLLLQEASASATADAATDSPVETTSGFRVVDYKPSGGFVHEFSADLSI